MSAPPLSDKVLKETVDLINQHGTVTEASRASGISRGTIKHRLDRAEAAGLVAGFELPEGQHVKGVSTLVNGKGETVVQWIKTREDKDKLYASLKAMAEEMSASLVKVKRRKKQTFKQAKDMLNLINIGDAHIGAYIWEEECGPGSAFDLDIAKRDLCTAMDYLIDEGPPADTLIIAPVGDFVHADNIAGATSKGTPLDLDTRMPKVIRTAVAVLRYAIEKGLDKHPTVRLVVTPGNHDQILSHCLAIMMEQAYLKEPRVIVHQEPSQRHYYQWGKVLLGWFHGHLINDAKIGQVVATEQAKLWGNTEYRYVYRGHHHHKSSFGLKEYNGIIVEQIRPLVPSDAYATSMGLLAGNDCMNISIHKEIGECQRITSSLKAIRMLQK